jgi:hypothetical protein
MRNKPAAGRVAAAGSLRTEEFTCRGIVDATSAKRTSGSHFGLDVYQRWACPDRVGLASHPSTDLPAVSADVDSFVPFLKKELSGVKEVPDDLEAVRSCLGLGGFRSCPYNRGVALL